MTISILASFVFSFHTYYVSFSEMEYNADEKKLETSLKLTAHDLKHELEEVYKFPINFEVQSDTTKETLRNYLERSFTVSQNGKKLKIVLDGYEYDLSGDLFVFFHYEKFKPKKSFIIENSILIQSFSQQQNIIYVKVGEKKYNKTLTSKDFTLFSDEG